MINIVFYIINIVFLKLNNRIYRNFISNALSVPHNLEEDDYFSFSLTNYVVPVSWYSRSLVRLKYMPVMCSRPEWTVPPYIELMILL